MEITLSTDPIVEKYLKLALENEDEPFTYNDTKFVNIKRLYDFVTEKVDGKFINFEEFLKEIIAEDDGTYELGSHETKSGNPETIDFDYEVEEDDNDDIVSETITF
jgi:hypothetical protein